MRRVGAHGLDWGGESGVPEPPRSTEVVDGPPLAHTVAGVEGWDRPSGQVDAKEGGGGGPVGAPMTPTPPRVASPEGRTGTPVAAGEVPAEDGKDCRKGTAREGYPSQGPRLDPPAPVEP